jgi:ribosome-binding protein aMBF1 (putative translation factor)
MDDSTRHLLPADLARALRDARLNLGLSQRGAAARIGITAAYVCMLEHAERCPSTDVAGDLIEALELSSDVAAQLLAVARPDAGRSWWAADAAATGQQPAVAAPARSL